MNFQVYMYFTWAAAIAFSLFQLWKVRDCCYPVYKEVYKDLWAVVKVVLRRLYNRANRTEIELKSLSMMNNYLLSLSVDLDSRVRVNEERVAALRGATLATRAVLIMTENILFRKILQANGQPVVFTLEDFREVHTAVLTARQSLQNSIVILDTA